LAPIVGAVGANLISKMNKFLNHYPKLRKPQVGDKIEIIKVVQGNYKVGDVGIIKHIGEIFTEVQLVNDINVIYLFRYEYALI
jgi:hypothetical protein